MNTLVNEKRMRGISIFTFVNSIIGVSIQSFLVVCGLMALLGTAISSRLSDGRAGDTWFFVMIFTIYLCTAVIVCEAFMKSQLKKREGGIGRRQLSKVRVFSLISMISSALFIVIDTIATFSTWNTAYGDSCLFVIPCYFMCNINLPFSIYRFVSSVKGIRRFANMQNQQVVLV